MRRLCKEQRSLFEVQLILACNSSSFSSSSTGLANRNDLSRLNWLMQSFFDHLRRRIGAVGKPVHHVVKSNTAVFFEQLSTEMIAEIVDALDVQRFIERCRGVESQRTLARHLRVAASLVA